MSTTKLFNRLGKCMKKPYSCFCKHIKNYKRDYVLGIFGSFAVVKMIILFVGFFGTLYHAQYHASAAGPTYINPLTFCSTVTQIPQKECWGIVDIYNSTDGQNRTDNTHRGLTTNICSWTGINCGIPGHVTRINLSNNNLSGNITSNIQFLSGLVTEIDFSYNTINNISPNISALSGMITFNASHNQLGDNSFEALVYLSGIQTINLNHNKIVNIPKKYALLADTVVYLDLSYNKIAEFNTIPDATSYVLIYLNLAHNLIRNIPMNLSNLYTIENLNLSKNFIGDTTASEIGDVAQTLIYLNLAHNLISKIPDSFNNFIKRHILLSLDMSYNFISDAIKISEISSLLFLNLANNRLINMIPLFKLTSLQTLDYGFNKLDTFPIIELLDVASTLKSFSLKHMVGDMKMTGPIPQNLTGLTQLQNGGSDISFNRLEEYNVTDPVLLAFLNQKFVNTSNTESYVNDHRRNQYRIIQTKFGSTLNTLGDIYGGDIIQVTMDYYNSLSDRSTSGLDLSIFNQSGVFTIIDPIGIPMKKNVSFDDFDPCKIDLRNNTTGKYFDVLTTRATNNGWSSFLDYLRSSYRDYDMYPITNDNDLYPASRGTFFVEWIESYTYDALNGSFQRSLFSWLFNIDLRDIAIQSCGIGGDQVTTFDIDPLAPLDNDSIPLTLKIDDNYEGDINLYAWLESDDRLYIQEKISTTNLTITVKKPSDSDGDGVFDHIDNCPLVANSGQEDSNYYITGAGTMNFTRPDGIGVDRNLAENQDRITDNVWLTRQNTQGIYNIFSETSYNGSSPADTEWAYGACADNISLFGFDTWNTTIDGNPPSMVGQDMCLHLITDDLYYNIMFTDWAVGNLGGQGGFAYTRTEFVRGNACDCNDTICTTGTDYMDNLICTPYDYICPAPDTDNDGITDNIDNCPLVANPLQEVSTSTSIPTFIFSKADYANYRLWENQDCITSDVCITRKNTQGIYNSISEFGYDSDSYISPIDTERATGICADSGSLTFNNRRTTVYPPTSMPGQDMCIHVLTDDTYYDINFISWTSSAGGGFSYTRSRPLGVACDCTDNICTTGTDYTGNLICNPDPICPSCGDENIDPGEECDTNNFGSYTCGDFGYTSGNLSCNTCVINTGACFTPTPLPSCGDGNIDPGEECEGSNFNGQTCANFGYDSGNLNCMSCTTDTSSCFNVPITPVAVCGNSIIETGEICDAINFNGQTCANFGYSLGTLHCNSCISFATGACYNPIPTPPAVVSTIGGGGGGGGGTSLHIDICPEGDYSTGYYDNNCGVKPTVTPIITPTVTVAKPSAPIIIDDRVITRLELAELVVPFILDNLDLPVYSTEKCIFSDIKNLSKNDQSIIKMSCRLRVMGREPNGLDIKPIYIPNTIVTFNEFATVYSRIINGPRYNIMNKLSFIPWYGNHLAALKKAGIVSSPVTITKSYVQSMLAKIQQNPDLLTRSDVNIGHATATTPIKTPTIISGNKIIPGAITTGTVVIGKVTTGVTITGVTNTSSPATSLSTSLTNILLDLSRFFDPNTPIITTGTVTTGAIITGQVHGAATTEPVSDMVIKYISPKTLLQDLSRFFD